MVDAMMSECPL